MTNRAIAGLLLTGGKSSRMGIDKATLCIDGVSLAQKLASLLCMVASPVIEVGPQQSFLPAVLEGERGAGPLVALCAGIQELARREVHTPIIVLACDLPNLSLDVLQTLAEWPGEGAVLPVIEGREQPLCARWSSADLAMAIDHAGRGQRSLRGLPGVGKCIRLHATQWGPHVDADTFADIDSPSDLRRLNLDYLFDTHSFGKNLS